MAHLFSNKLVNETSPYLLQHAHNPVYWFPWGDEALQKAKAEDKIILVSIGYAACHWCHVMEKESFEHEATAKIMNEHFINIKIDREERPDLDHIYMDAVQAMTGSGGWPLNVFLTPDTKPFYGGTYFPPVRAFNKASWTEILLGVQRGWKERRYEIETQADTLIAHLERSHDFGQVIPAGTDIYTKEQCNLMYEHVMKNADTRWGGFGKAPKFPQTFTIQYLLQYHHFTKDKTALRQALLSIDKMLEGGIYDHVGGGLSRYSTDEEWLAPHFEKMLYDNALLLGTLSDAFAITKDKKYESAIRHIISFAQRELQDPAGGFYAALDADSEGEEGKFYVWQQEEINSLLGEDAALFNQYFDVTVTGNWEGKNILRILQPAATVATDNNLSPTDLENIIRHSLDKLLLARNKRTRPLTDDKLLLSWNALMVIALCKAAAVLQDEQYKELARHTMQFILRHFKDKESKAFFHTYKNGIAKYPAFLDDYCYLIQACIQLQEISSDPFYLYEAKALTAYVIDNFEDETTGYFFFTGKQQADVIVRKKEVYDGATPSGNSIMAQNLFYLAVIFDEIGWYHKASRILGSLSAAVIKYPSSFGVWAACILQQVYGTNEIVVTGKQWEEGRDELLTHFLPNKVLQAVEKADNEFPMLQGKPAGDKTRFFLCKQYACRQPVDTAQQLMEQLI